MADNNAALQPQVDVELYEYRGGRKQYICPICGNDIYVSTSRYLCQYCHTPLYWPEEEFKKFNKH